MPEAQSRCTGVIEEADGAMKIEYEKQLVGRKILKNNPLKEAGTNTATKQSTMGIWILGEKVQGQSTEQR